MALAYFITDPDRGFIEKLLGGGFSNWKERDLCLWACFLGTPCTILELNRIQIGDVITKKGELVKNFVIRGNKGFTGLEREIYLTNRKLCNVLSNLINSLLSHKNNAGDHPDYYKGLDPTRPLFQTEKGDGFSITKKDVPATEKKEAHTLYNPNSLRRHIMDFMKEGGIEYPNADSGRRTFATKLHRQGVYVYLIHHLLGNKRLETTKKIIESDPVNMGSIAAKAY